MNFKATGKPGFMNRPTLLLLSTYPFQRPRHGGQIRLSEIARTYRNSGFMVHPFAVYELENYHKSDVGADDVPFDATSSFRLYRGRRVPFINNFLAGRFAASDEGAFQKIQRRVPSHVDVIEIEQPWLLPLAQRLRRELPACRHACLVYGSQNIEAPMIKSIFDSHGMCDADDVLADIDALEREAAREADLVFAVTAGDKTRLENFGARKVLLVHNGIASWRVSAERLDYWRSRLPAAPWLLFVASAHPPNFTDFMDCIGYSLACIPPSSRFVVAGSVGVHLHEILSKSRWRDINLSRLIILGMLDDQDLAAVKALTHGFLLPILAGGGSNIKTAEALYSGKYVICTPASLRGFDAYRSLPEVTVAESPAQFQAAIRAVLCSAPAAPITPQSKGIREGLLWDHCLAALPTIVTQLLENKKLVA